MKFSKSLSALTLKAMSVFGGVQMLTILCSVVRNKLAAIWIGPAGVGLLAIYNSAMEMLTTTGTLNIRQSAVREISAVDGSQRSTLIAALRRIGLIIGLLGTAAVLLASPLIAWLAFDDRARWHGFAALSAMMLMASVSAIELAVLQATGRLRRLARAGLWTAVAATAIAVPLFYVIRLKAVVPVIFIFGAAQMIFALAEREPAEREDISLRAAWTMALPTLRLGLWLTASASITLAGSFAFLAWLNRTAGTDTVGLYQAGYTLVNSYVGVIFTAISMEYYPRLSAAAKAGMGRMSLLVTHETNICLWVLMPVIVAFVSLSPLIVNILYASNFADIVPFIAIAVTGTLLKAQSWCMAFVILARGDGRAYIVSETLSMATGLACNIIGWKYGAWIGLGVSYVIWYGIYTLIVWLICRQRYGLHTRPSQWGILLLGIAISAAALVLKFTGLWWIGLAALLPVSLYLTYRGIFRRRL